MQSTIFALVALISIPLQALTPVASSQSQSERWLSPVSDGAIVRGFDSHTTYGPGHRGVDFAVADKSTVRAVAAGRVVWAGKVAGRYTISIDHGTEKSTYEPVSPDVKVGDRLEAGDAIGRLASGNDHCEASCLHLGRVQADTYLDPEERLESNDGFRLISPIGAPPKPPIVVLGTDAIPVKGVVTSRFGMRMHPITKKYSFHDGTDIGAPCGQPVASMGPGTVSFARSRSGYGLQVEIVHSAGVRTSYAHLSSTSVRAGARVERGQVIGAVGQTGRATGCHVHLMKLRDGHPIDPEIR